MVISQIIKEDFIYYNLHAEQTISSTYFASDLGIYVSELFDSTLSRIDKNLCEIDLIKNYTLYLDFEGIDYASKNLSKDLANIKSKVKHLIFINITQNVLEQLNLDDDFVLNPNNEKYSDDDKFKIFYFGNDITTVKIISSLEIFEEKLLKTIIKYNTNCEKDPHLHESSSVYLTSFIDIKKMISYETSFMMFCLYNLALKIKTEWIKNLNDTPILVCQNLNSSFITSILSNLLKLDVIILDHVGPINTVYSTLNNKIEQDKKYIVVSDVVCLGTEVKIAKNLIAFLGGKVIGNVSVVKLDTLVHEDISKEKNKNISVFNINKENNSKIKFKIKTALD
jgi:hypothetical protein